MTIDTHIINYPLRGGNNQFLTASLFYEPYFAMQEEFRAIGTTPVFTLHVDREGYINAHTTFVAERDPTGIKWSTKYIGGPQHLLRLLASDWFREAYESWVEETEQVMSSEAVELIRKISTGGSPAAFQAAKYIANKDYKKGSSKRGRPSSEEIKGELKKAVRQAEGLASDAERIVSPRLKVVS